MVGAAVDNENKVTYIDNDNKELGHEAVNYLQAKVTERLVLSQTIYLGK